MRNQAISLGPDVRQAYKKCPVPQCKLAAEDFPVSLFETEEIVVLPDSERREGVLCLKRGKHYGGILSIRQKPKVESVLLILIVADEVPGASLGKRDR